MGRGKGRVRFLAVAVIAVGVWGFLGLRTRLRPVVRSLAKTQVINTEGNVIPSLFACGEVTGGIHGSNRLGGNAIADCMTYGKLAGEMAASNK